MAVAAGCSGTKSPVDYVDPFIGTGFHGHTYPGATAPFGAVQLSPDTRNAGWDACSGYHYSDSTIIGFSHTHLSGTGCADLADILFHPTSKEADLKPQGYIFEPLAFSHADEQASPGYYSVEFREAGIRAELTATRYAGVHRYTYAKRAQQNVIIDLKHAIDGKRADMIGLHRTGANEIAGMKRTRGWTPNNYTFFVAQFSRDIVSVDLICDGVVIAEGEEFPSNNVQAVVRFGESDGTPLVAKVGLSKVSEENARENLLHDVKDFDFDAVHEATRMEWAENLSLITVEGGTEDEMKLFYTSVYRTRIVPNVMSDVNGQYRRHDTQVAQVDEGRKYYSTLSLWDTFRAWNPLMTMTDHRLVEDMIWSMLEMYDTTGELPIWPLACGETFCMIGYHSVSVIADAYLKGIRGFDAEKALEAMKRSSDINRKGSKYYLEYGYIPSDLAGESVSCLLEYAYDDWCIARMAEAMGRAEDAANYYRRARNYVNAFDGHTKFFRSRRSDGNWDPQFNPFEPTAAYTEATAWQYRFFAPHDVNGLVQLFGGLDEFISALDDLFTAESKIDGHVSDITGLIGQYAQGNEPSHHMAYLYNWVGQPWKTQEMTRRLLAEQYQATPEGISGNEDCGQMSAWYVMTAIGIYPVSPGSNEFALTTPLFPRAVVRLAGGGELAITANDPAKNTYIDKVELNGVEIAENFVTYEQLAAGGELKFTLRATPNTERGTSVGARPYSLTRGAMVSPPYTTQELGGFLGEVDVELASATEGAAIRYTLDGSEPDENAHLYTGPVKITDNVTIKARAYKDGFEPSGVMSVRATGTKLHGAVNPGGVRKGVKYSYFKGSFSSVHQMSRPVSTGVTDVVSIAQSPAVEAFGYTFEGWIRVPEDGLYTFLLKTDDGSMLYVDDREVITNDGPHSAKTMTGRIALRKGFHPYKLMYFQGSGGSELTFRWAVPGSDGYEDVPAEVLYTR